MKSKKLLPKKLVLLDDDYVIRFVLKKVLLHYFSPDRLEIFTSADGVEGLGYVFITRPEIIIIDTTLPEYGGLEIIDYIKTNHALNEIGAKVIVVLHGGHSVKGLPKNYLQLNKHEANFLDKLIQEVSNIIDPKAVLEKPSWIVRAMKFLGRKALLLADGSDTVAIKYEHRKNIFLKLQWILLQFATSIYLSLFYFFTDSRDIDINEVQGKKDLMQSRVRVYPAVAVIMATFLIGLGQILLVFGSFFGVFTFTNTVFAASYSWDGGGLTNNWSDCANWSTDICPVAADTVTFNATSTKDAVVDAGFAGTVAILNINSGYTGTISLSRALVVSATYTQSDGTFTAGANNLTVSTTFTLNTGATFNASSATTTISGAFTINGGTFNHNSGTVSFTGAAATLSCNDIAFNLVTLTSITNVKTINSNCTLPLGNNPTVGRFTLNGTFTGTGTLNLAGSGTFTVNSTGVISGFTAFNSASALTVAGASLNWGSFTSFVTSGTFIVSSGSMTVPNNSDFNGALTVSGGTFNSPSGTMTVAGSFTISGSPTFNHNNGTITFDGGGATLACNSSAFNLVSFNNSGSKTINSDCNLPVGSNPTFAGAGGLVLNGTLTGSGTINKAAGTFQMNSGSSISGFNDLAISAFTVAGANVDLSAYDPIVVGATLTLSSGTLTMPSSADLNNALLISGGTFTAPSGTMTVAGALSITGVPIFNHNSGTITLDGTTGGIDCASATFNLITINRTSTTTVNSNCNLPLGNDPTIGAGAVTLNGTLSGLGTLTKGSSVFTLNSGATLSGFSAYSINNLTVSGATADFSGSTFIGSMANVIINSGSLSLPTPQNVDVNGAFTLNGGTFNATAGEMTVAGAFTVSAGTFNHNNGTVTFDSPTTATIDCNNIVFNLISFNSNVTKTVNSTCTLPLGNNPTLGNSGSITLNGTLSGTGTLTKASGALTLNTGAALSGFNGLDISSLAIAGAIADLSTYSSFTASGAVTVSSGLLSLPNNSDLNSTFVLSSGVFNAPSGTMSVAGNFTISGGTFNHNNGTINFDSTSATLVCNNTIFNLVTFTHSGGAKVINSDCSLPLGDNPTVTGRITLNGTLSGSGTLTATANNVNIYNAGAAFSGFTGYVHTQGTFELAGAVLDFSGYTEFTINALTLTSGTFTGPMSAGMTIGSYSHTGGTFNQATGGTTSMTSLTLNGASAVFNGSSSDLDLNGIFTLTDGTFNAPSGNMFVSSSFNIQAGDGIFNDNDGTVVLDPGVSGSFMQCNSQTTLHKVQFSNSGAVVINSSCPTIPLGNDPTVTGRLTLNGVTLTGTGTFTSSTTASNAFRVDAGVNTVSGFTTMNFAGSITVNNGSTLSFGNVGTVNSNSTLTVTGSNLVANSGVLNLNSTFAYTGSSNFTHNNGTIVYKYANPTLPNANLTFNNLTYSVTSPSTLTFTANTTQTILGTLTLKGTSSVNKLSLRSTINGTQWIIDPQGLTDIQYVDVRDSNNINATSIATNGTGINSGNNINWNLNNPTASSLGPNRVINGTASSNKLPDFTFIISDSVDSAYSIKYRIQIDNNSNFASPEIDYTSELLSQGSHAFTTGQAAGSGTYVTGSTGQTLADGSYYWRVGGMENGVGLPAYTAAANGSVAFKVDSTAPTGNIDIVDDSTSSDPMRVKLNISATDAVAGLSQMMISTSSNFTGASYETYSTTKNFAFTDNVSGTKTVYIKFKDNAGNQSIVYSDSIIILLPGSSIPEPEPEPEPAPGEEPVPEPEPTPGEEPAPEDLYTLNVTVVDLNDQPLAGVTVNIRGEEVITDENGIATIKNVEEGNSSLVLGFNDKSGRYNISVQGPEKEIQVKVVLEERSPINMLLIAIPFTCLVAIIIALISYTIFHSHGKSKWLKVFKRFKRNNRHKSKK